MLKQEGREAFYALLERLRVKTAFPDAAIECIGNDQEGDARGFVDACGIDLDDGGMPHHGQDPAFIDIPHRSVGELTNTDTIMQDTFFIGVYPGIEDIQLDYIDSVFRRFMDGERLR